MEIKVAEYSDFERIAGLHAKSWQRFYSGILSKAYLGEEVQSERKIIWQTRLTNPPFNQAVYVLEEGGLLCGFVCGFGNHDFERGTIIDALHVDDYFRGRGIGLTLLKAIADWARQYFPDNGVYLEVLKGNQQAIDFYEHIGGQLAQERLWNAPCGTQVPELVYTWPSPDVLYQQVDNLLQRRLVTN